MKAWERTERTVRVRTSSKPHLTLAKVLFSTPLYGDITAVQLPRLSHNKAPTYISRKVCKLANRLGGFVASCRVSKVNCFFPARELIIDLLRSRSVAVAAFGDAAGGEGGCIAAADLYGYSFCGRAAVSLKF